MNFMNLIFFVMKKIGILGFQGAIVEHERQIKAIGHEPVIVKYPGSWKRLMESFYREGEYHYGKDS